MVFAVITLVIIDILFLVTGQLSMESFSSLTINAILDPSSITFSSFWDAMIGKGGLGALVAVVGVTVGTILSATNVLVFLPLGFVFAVLIGDYLTVYGLLNANNPVLATMIMVPVMMAFILTIIEWVRAKD